MSCECMKAHPSSSHAPWRSLLPVVRSRAQQLWAMPAVPAILEPAMPEEGAPKGCCVLGILCVTSQSCLGALDWAARAPSTVPARCPQAQAMSCAPSQQSGCTQAPENGNILKLTTGGKPRQFLLLNHAVQPLSPLAWISPHPFTEPQENVWGVQGSNFCSLRAGWHRACSAQCNSWPSEALVYLLQVRLAGAVVRVTCSSPDCCQAEKALPLHPAAASMVAAVAVQAEQQCPV